MRWLCIDPGISGTGYAYFQNDSLKKYGSVYPEKKLESWEQRTSSILHKLLGAGVWKNYPTRVYIEWPTNFIGRRGLAATNSNDILKLCCLIGRVAQHYISAGSMVMLVPVQQWKGNLPKPIVTQRAKRFFQLSTLTSHAADAVGIGRYVLKSSGHDKR